MEAAERPSIAQKTDMLDAYLRKKANLPTERDPDGHRRVIEDAITSTLFTPIRFMTPLDASRILSLLIGDPSIAAPKACRVELWPKFAAALGLKNFETVEPDVVFELQYPESTTRTAIEIKWDAVLRLDQVKEQIAGASLDMKASDTFQHISIVKSADLETFSFPKTKVREWTGVLNDLKRASANECDGQLKNVTDWCRDVGLFLERLGIGSFEGFGGLSLRPVSQGIEVPVWQEFAWADLQPVRPTHDVLNFAKR